MRMDGEATTVGVEAAGMRHLEGALRGGMIPLWGRIGLNWAVGGCTGP